MRNEEVKGIIKREKATRTQKQMKYYEDGCLLVVAPCSLVTHRPDDGGSKHLRNVGKLLPDYMAEQPRRQPSSYSPP
jgi:hypothetical protein